MHGLTRASEVLHGAALLYVLVRRDLRGPGAQGVRSLRPRVTAPSPSAELLEGEQGDSDLPHTQLSCSRNPRGMPACRRTRARCHGKQVCPGFAPRPCLPPCACRPEFSKERSCLESVREGSPQDALEPAFCSVLNDELPGISFSIHSCCVALTSC